MPILSNAKRELFATELARGVSAKDAYERAGYRPHRANAAKLAHAEDVRARVTEILAEREAIHAQATAEAIRETGLSKQWVIEQLRENAKLARDLNQIAASNRALELLGREQGMFIDRLEINNVNHVVSAEPLTAEQWAQKHSEPTTH